MNETWSSIFSGSNLIPVAFIMICLILPLAIIAKSVFENSMGVLAFPTATNASNNSGMVRPTTSLIYNNLSVASIAHNFTSIFDGKTLDGWKMAGEGKFVVDAEERSIQSNGGLGIMWYTKEKYGDFVLQLEWKAAKKGDNSGVFVRFPPLTDDPDIAVRYGYEIQINDMGEDAQYKTGAIAGFLAPKKVVLKPIGQWNTMQIEVVGQSYSVSINGKNIIEYTGNRLTEGYLGLQAHDENSKISFRNIMVGKILTDKGI